MAEMKIDITDVIERAIEKIKAEGYTVQKWIPCSERLPETNTQVLCYCRTGDFRLMEFDDQESRWYEGIHDYRQASVTHWMPLSKPPESEVQDDD